MKSKLTPRENLTPEIGINIKNFTPHPINMVNGEGECYKTFESVGLVRLSSSTITDSPISGIPTSKTVFGDPDGLPGSETTWICKGETLRPTRCNFKNETGGPCLNCGGHTVEQPKTFYIVSQLVKSACVGRNDLLVPAEVVRDNDGKIIGCRSLGR